MKKEQEFIDEDPENHEALLKKEYDLTCRMVLMLKQQNSLLLEASPLRRSLASRKPYVDLINYIQIILLKRLKKNPELNKDQEFIKTILMGYYKAKFYPTVIFTSSPTWALKKPAALAEGRKISKLFQLLIKVDISLVLASE